MRYCKLDTEGYIQYIVNSTIEQPSLLPLNEDFNEEVLKSNKYNYYTGELASPLTLQETIDQKLQEINFQRSSILAAPILFQGNYYDTDSVSLNNLNLWASNIANGSTLPDNFTWRDANNIEHPADSTFIISLNLAITTRISQIYKRSWQIKSDIEILTTIEEVNSYVISW